VRGVIDPDPAGLGPGASALGPVVERLRAAGCVAAEEEGRELLAAAADEAVLEAWVGRRARGEPLAWITGTTHFCGRVLHVSAGVFEPRWHTEALARRAATLLPPGGAAADLFCGTGAIAVHLADVVPTSRVVAVDVDPVAVRCARRNGVLAVLGDVGAPLRSTSVDLVTAVAPYVPSDELRLLPRDVRRHTPMQALDGGADGLDLVRRLLVDAWRVLRPDGWLVLELGGRQDVLVVPALASCGFVEVAPWRDAEGDVRGVAARRP
jgi:release factor glutamine methyltransferase